MAGLFEGGLRNGVYPPARRNYTTMSKDGHRDKGMREVEEGEWRRRRVKGRGRGGRINRGRRDFGILGAHLV